MRESSTLMEAFQERWEKWEERVAEDFIRNEGTEWVKGFYSRLPNCFALEVELWELMEVSIWLCKKKGLIPSKQNLTPKAWWKSSMKDHTREPYLENSFVNAGT